MTEDLVAKLDALEKEATRGPWAINDRNEYGDQYIGNADEHWFIIAEKLGEGLPSADGNSLFVVALRNAWPRLRAIVVAAQKWEKAYTAYMLGEGQDTADALDAAEDELVTAVRGEA